MPAIEHERIAQLLEQLGERATEGTEIELVEISLRGAGKARLVRAYIDKPGGVTHGDCELISARIGALLDEGNVMPDDSYTLEVSSPGVERKLSKARDFERVVGQNIKVALREPIAALKRAEGKLLRFADDTLEVETPGGDVLQIPLRQVQKANLKFDW